MSYDENLYDNFERWLKFLGYTMEDILIARRKFQSNNTQSPTTLIIPANFHVLGLLVQVSKDVDSLEVR